jgi:hypothetical protein
MGMITEDQLEQLCLDWFRDQGWEYAYGPDIAPIVIPQSAVTIARLFCMNVC